MDGLTRKVAVLAAMTAYSAALSIVPIASGGEAEQEQSPGRLNGWVAAKRNSGESVPAESVSVFVLFTNEMEEGNFSHDLDGHTAGRQFAVLLNKFLEKNRALKKLAKKAGDNPTPDAADQISTLYLATVDDALNEVRTWLSRHQKWSWQLKTLTTDARGQWGADNLQPGTYTIVARGKIYGYDGYWEARVDLPPGATISAPLTRPRFLRRETTAAAP